MPVRALPDRPRGVRGLWRGGGWTAVAVLTTASPAAAHHPGGGHVEPFAIVPMALVAGGYLWAVLRLRGGAPALPPWRIGAFLLGIAALAAALLPPLEDLAWRFLSAHMAQHFLLTLIAAPLLVLGAPFAPLVRALPMRARRGGARLAGRLLGLGGGWGSGRWLVVATGAYVVVLGAWHVPALYQAALGSSAVHALEHALFLGAALFFWWSVAGAARRGAHGVGILAVFLSGLATGALAALITFSPRLWYPVYTAGGWGLSPLEDQHVAGALMWVPGGVIHGVAAVLLFLGWLSHSERRVIAAALPGEAARAGGG